MVVFTDRQLDILFKLWRNRCFRRNATLQIDNVIKGAPSHLIGEIKEEMDELIKKNIVIRIPHKHGGKVFINPLYKNEIKRDLKKIYPFI
ncbi:unnamed protein product [marine sediment metagenome]|uniref:Uncharacterized protein n=1 Tax=marine sediment metagenome TaxID=412755 RepID=X0WV66_9ZZZZ